MSKDKELKKGRIAALKLADHILVDSKHQVFPGSKESKVLEEITTKSQNLVNLTVSPSESKSMFNELKKVIGNDIESSDAQFVVK